jgi:hypothetical protein
MSNLPRNLRLLPTGQVVTAFLFDQGKTKEERLVWDNEHLLARDLNKYYSQLKSRTLTK